MKIKPIAEETLIQQFSFAIHEPLCCSYGMELIGPKYVMDLGDARRGQHYYFLISHSWELSIFSDRPYSISCSLALPQKAIDFLTYIKQQQSE